LELDRFARRPFDFRAVLCAHGTPAVTPAAILDALPVLVLELSRDLSVRYVNAPLAARLNASPAELIGLPADRLGLDQARFGDWTPVARAAVAAGRTTEWAFARTRFRFTPHPAADGSADGVVVIAAEDCAAVPEVGELFRQFMTHVPFAAWLRDEHSRYVYTNPVYARATTSTADWAGKHLSEVWPADQADRFADGDRRVLHGGRAEESLDAVPTADGAARTWHTVRFPLAEADGRRYVAGLAIDLTDRLKLEEDRRALERQLLYAQKVDSLEVMAGGVAHDFNNLLTTILGNASLARMNVSVPSPVAECLRRVEGAAMRAAELCQQMLAYSGRGQFATREVDLNAVVREVVGVLGTVISRRATVTLALADPPPVVQGDPGQMRQAVLNLLTNASDAIGDADGVITVTTAVDPDAGAATLTVSDTGGGIDEATRGRIFEPFFTTKFTGRGLGLSAVQGIVRGHRGTIAVTSQVGKGSTFRVVLPAGSPPAPARRAGRGRTVLVIDDEDDVRLVARRLLEANGFTVLPAAGPADGVATFRNFHEQVAVVLLDLTLPKPGGPAVLHELRRIRADVRVVFTGGVGVEPPAAAGGGRVALLRKPFSGDELLDAVFHAADA
jgi:PAS domain S-box-containing protein